MVKGKCKRCGYEWNYTGKRVKLLEKIKVIYISCPYCKTSVTIKKEIKKL